ncbi:MAG TPA: crosslink repair DNA glycosylase YcaQ family protein [Mycobacteriales bacterium]|nr:crosslink repair DNA glycosylase YcaQ family protein [Mycobacteriales bacterium]
MLELSATEARRVALRAQGLLGAREAGGGVPAMLHRLGAVQLDTIAVLARSHELVAYARLGPVGRAAVEAAYWNGGGFEYWAHAACVLPVKTWPWFAFRRREWRARGRRWHPVSPQVCDEVLARLLAEGPLTATELGGAKAGGPWWDWSQVKVAVEWLWDIGEVAVVQRRGWRRVHDLPERALPSSVLPSSVLAPAPSDEECLTHLVERAGRALGVATRADLAEYFRLRGDQVDAGLPGCRLVPVRVAGWREAAWADPDALAAAGARGRHRTTLLSPFDSLIWDRRRTARLFGFRHRLEAYLPPGKREHGYFVTPVLAGGRLVGRVDPVRRGRTLVARRVSVDTASAVAPTAAALTEAASWVGCEGVLVERVVPDHRRPALVAALGEVHAEPPDGADWEAAGRHHGCHQGAGARRRGARGGRANTLTSTIPTTKPATCAR